MDETEIVRVLERRGAAAVFVTQLRHALGPAWSDARLGDALARLAAREEILLVEKSVPDPHLAGADLRIVARGADAAASAEALWNGWLREFLASHRCS